MKAASTTELAAMTAQAQPAAGVFNPQVLDAMTRAAIDGTWCSHWQMGRLLLELRVVAVGGHAVGGPQ